jgi:hypothetical protein
VLSLTNIRNYIFILFKVQRSFFITYCICWGITVVFVSFCFRGIFTVCETLEQNVGPGCGGVVGGGNIFLFARHGHRVTWFQGGYRACNVYYTVRMGTIRHLSVPADSSRDDDEQTISVETRRLRPGNVKPSIIVAKDAVRSDRWRRPNQHVQVERERIRFGKRARPQMTTARRWRTDCVRWLFSLRFSNTPQVFTRTPDVETANSRTDRRCSGLLTHVSVAVRDDRGVGFIIHQGRS